ncbi:MAG: efflux RND transporter periplasmic adaptor subunit [Verrucomicrobiales bacterium]|nr:efflux RND transporter periplasmic adaptor subunit [Verrucomicrobiales bacterium]
MKSVSKIPALSQSESSANTELSIDYDWVSEAEAIFRSDSELQLLPALANFLTLVTDANAGLIYQTGRENGAVCAARAARKNLPPGLLENPALSALAIEAGAKASFVHQPVTSEKAVERFQAAALPTGVDDLVFVIVKSHSQRSAAETARLMRIPLAVLKQYFDRKELSRVSTGFDRASVLLEMLYRAGQIPQFQRAMGMLADETRRFAECKQSALGVGDKYGCRLWALSGQTQVDRLSHPNVLLRNFMRESIAVDRAIVWPPPAELPADLDISGNADELLTALKVDMITALPLKTDDGKQVGAWVCLWEGDEKKALQRWGMLDALVPHLASMTQLVVAAKPRGIRRLISALGTGRWVRRLVGLMITAAVVAAMFVQLSYPITVDCRLEPEVTRQVAAPFEGILAAPRVKTGDLVTEGQLLATLDGKEIGWRLSELKAKREVVIRERDQAMASDNLAAVQLAELDLKSADLEVSLLEYRKDKLEIRSPIAGLVMSGDLEKSRGVPVSLGQKLFDIASIDTLKVQLAIPDMEFSHSRLGMPVKMRLESQVKFGFEMELDAIYPASESVEGKNVFIGIARVENESGWLRPGMRGKARIYSDKKPLGWILFHKPWEFVRLNLWW